MGGLTLDGTWGLLPLSVSLCFPSAMGLSAFSSMQSVLVYWGNRRLRATRPRDYGLKLKIMSPNKPFILINCLSQVFCHGNEKLSDPEPIMYILSQNI